jgi:hypothetical protein
MSKKETPLTKETLKTRAEVCQYESSIKSVEVDSRVLSRLISLGSGNSETTCFAKLFGYLDTAQMQLHVKDCVGLPCLQEDDQKKLIKQESEEKAIRNSLGFNYQFLGTFVISENEDTFGENLGFYLTHYNIYEGFGVMLVYSKEIERTSQMSPIQAFVPSKGLSQTYKFKIDKELFEPDPNELTNMIKNNEPLLRKVPIKTSVSPVLELITSRNQHQLRLKNPVDHKSDSKANLISNLESSLSQTVHQMMNVLNSRRSLEMRRQHLMNFGGAINRVKSLLEIKRRKLDEDAVKLRNLESLVNRSDETN